MKKFKFSLEKILKFKERMLDIEIGRLNELRHLLSRQKDELNKLFSEYRDIKAQFNQKARTGILITDIGVYKSFIRELEQQIEAKEAQIAETTYRIELKTEEVKEAKTEIKSIEILKEKKWSEYNFKEIKEQELFIEEFVSYGNVAD